MRDAPRRQGLTVADPDPAPRENDARVPYRTFVPFWGVASTYGVAVGYTVGRNPIIFTALATVWVLGLPLLAAHLIERRLRRGGRP